MSDNIAGIIDGQIVEPQEETQFDSQIKPSVLTNSTSHIFQLIDLIVSFFARNFGVDNFQIYLLLTLWTALLCILFCISLAWNYYSPIIVEFDAKNQLGGFGRQIDRDRLEKDKKRGIMDRFKNFLKNKKVNKHFKRTTGPGQKLSDGPSASIISGVEQGGSVDRIAAADIAAQAAYKRLYKDDKPAVSYSQKKIQMLAQREIDEEKKRNDLAASMGELGLKPKRETDKREFEHNSSINGVYYTCELLGDDVSLKKPELMLEIERYLKEQIKECDREDKVVASVLLLFSLNNRETVDTAIAVLEKYIQNILSSDDPKFRRIKMSNKAFQDRVVVAKGAVEFLNSIGFSEQQLSVGDAPPEAYFVIEDADASDAGFLVSSLESLKDGQSLPIKVSRNISVFLMEENAKLLPASVPNDFFNLTAEEVKKEQQLKTEEVERMLTLRTKEMRERDSCLRNYKYKYTCIRIKFPDRLVIQGTFGSYEPFSAVREFLVNHLSDSYQAMEWNLKDPTNPNKVLKDDSSLVDLGLAPAAVLFLDICDGVAGPSLQERFRVLAQPLTA